jgi:hypothetical protein
MPLVGNVHPLIRYSRFKSILRNSVHILSSFNVALPLLTHRVLGSLPILASWLILSPLLDFMSLLILRSVSVLRVLASLRYQFLISHISGEYFRFSFLISILRTDIFKIILFISPLISYIFPIAGSSMMQRGVLVLSFPIKFRVLA